MDRPGNDGWHAAQKVRTNTPPGELEGLEENLVGQQRLGEQRRFEVSLRALDVLTQQGARS